MTDNPFPHEVTTITDDIAQMLIDKNAAYGDSALNPVRVFSRASTEEQLLVRIDDKLSRIARGHKFPGEDVLDDTIGYLIMLKIARQRNAPGESAEEQVIRVRVRNDFPLAG